MSESDLATSSPPPPSPLFRPPLPPPLTPSTLCEVSWRWWWAVVVSRLVTMVVSSFYLVVAIVSLVLQHHRHVCVCMCACACVVLLVSSLYQRGAQHPSPLVTELLCCPRRRTRRLIWVMARKEQGMPRMAGGDEGWVLFRGAAAPDDRAVHAPHCDDVHGEPGLPRVTRGGVAVDGHPITEAIPVP